MDQNIGGVAKSVQHNNASYLVFSRNETNAWDDED
jgi:hypothetical protein